MRDGLNGRKQITDMKNLMNSGTVNIHLILKVYRVLLQNQQKMYMGILFPILMVIIVLTDLPALLFLCRLQKKQTLFKAH